MSPSDTCNIPFSSGINYTNNTADRSRFESMEGSIASFQQGFARFYATGGQDLGSSEVSTSEGGMNCHIGNPG
jgi:hypothetical protein